MSFTIEAVITDKVGFASHQNAAPIIRQLAIQSASEDALEKCNLKLASDPAFFE
jgi:hypothetical protein